MKTLLKYYWLVSIITIAIWLLVGWRLGTEALTLCVILTLLEITFSADNAVVNSRVLVTLSPFWQKMFMTVGIILAVFVVRFILPIVIVMVGAELSFDKTFDLALNHPEAYKLELDKAAPVINAFGAMFLFLVALDFFIDPKKKISWLVVEKYLVSFAKKIPHAGLLIGFGILVVTVFTLSSEVRLQVSAAMFAAILLYSGLKFINHLMEKHEKNSKLTHKVGMAAFLAFVYLQILDASFSLDGVIGAFALTDNIIIIMAGLGAGAIWVREMTLHMVHTNALVRYRYLEHGAHWAIFVLGLIMLLKLVHIEPPEVFVGVVGLVFVAASLYSSYKSHRQEVLTH
ncbi:MAG: DUF475 domain-containing protein [Candidatus Saccharibacteria bacterium]|nr:DUF475 domain-containing protein [Candidatus Saccharibacteria bacterium]